MFKKIFQLKAQSYPVSLALLLLRLNVGIAFVIHGWGKIQSPFSWIPPEAPMHIPAVFQFLAAVAEFCGGIALVIGLITPLASLGIGITMSVALYAQIVLFKAPLVNLQGGNSYEIALAYFCLAVLFLAAGPGKFSVDGLIFGERKI